MTPLEAVSFDEAVAAVAGLARPLGREPVSLAEAAGRRLAAPVVACIDSPRCRVSAMDGYAVAGAGEVGARYRLAGESLPGRGYDGRIDPSVAVRIFTGAPVPDGADRVVVQERVHRERDEVVVIEEATSERSNIREPASDIRAGEVLLAEGRVLDPRALVVAAAADTSTVEVFRRPRVVVLATGDELVEAGRARESAFGVPESVSYGVVALAGVWGADVRARRRLPDDLPLMLEAADAALDQADVVVVTGGASVGERDYGKAMFEEHGLELVFAKVAIRPGRPAWLGRARGTLVAGLPGNPSSALITARLFAAPLLCGLAGGAIGDALGWRPTTLLADVPAQGDRETFLRGRSLGAGVDPSGRQDSSGQSSLADSDVLIRRRAHAPALARGEEVETIRFEPSPG